MAKRKKIAFIINPVAGGGNKKHLPAKIEKHIDYNLYKPDIVFTSYSGHAAQLASGFRDLNYHLVVAVGGDGTTNEIASTLTGGKTALGIIPSGSGNGLARHLKIPFSVNLSMQIINKSRTAKIDVGKINDKYFFCTCGIGFDAVIGHRFATQPERGIQSYVGAVINELFSYRPQEYTIKMDGAEIKRNAFLITFANASQYGNNAFIAPKADICDGLMDVCIVAPFPLIKAVDLSFKLFNKQVHKFDHIEFLKARRITIKRQESGEVHFDGEPAQMGKKLKIRIYHKRLNVVVPPDFVN